MADTIISLRQFIDRRNEFPNARVHTFCRLMKKVSEAIEKEERNIIRINIDEIKIDTTNGEIVFPDSIFADGDRTIAGFNTGISLVADRKSSNEHKKVAIALMILGWYVNDDNSAITSDLEVLENFDRYMMSVPAWLQDYFVGVFRRMDYEMNFSDYYKVNFTDTIKNVVNETFKIYELGEKQIRNITKVIVIKAENMALGGGLSA